MKNQNTDNLFEPQPVDLTDEMQAKIDANAAEMDAEDAIDGDREPITEETAAMALRLLAETGHERPSVRDLAKAWGWHRSRVHRFLSRQTMGAVSSPVSTNEPSHTGFSPFSQGTDGEGNTWFLDNEEHIVIAEQSAIALYWNERNDLVIRQERSWCDDHDHILLVNRRNLSKFIDALCAIAGIGGVGK